MRRDPGDIVDRLSIALLKSSHIGTVHARQEVAMFMDGLIELLDRHPDTDWFAHIVHMREINGRIWDMEAAVRAGALDGNLSEVGARAIAIRHANAERVALKNAINRTVHEGVEDEKFDHISAGINGGQSEGGHTEPVLPGADRPRK